MTQKDLQLAVTQVNNTIATNNPKGLTEALKNAGYPVDIRFDILSYDALTQALMELYIANPKKWAEVVKSVSFNYEKSDSSTSASTRTAFENISRSIDPNYDAVKAISKEKGKWWQTALEYILGATTTVSYGPSAPSSPKISPWVYVGFSILALVVLLIVFIAIKNA